MKTHYKNSSKENEPFYDDAVEVLVTIKGEIGALKEKENKRYGNSAAERRLVFTHILELIANLGRRHNISKENPTKNEGE